MIAERHREFFAKRPVQWEKVLQQIDRMQKQELVALYRSVTASRRSKSSHPQTVHNDSEVVFALVLRLARLFLHQGDRKSAQHWLDIAAPSVRFYREVQKTQREVRAGKLLVPERFAVLLPLSGRHRQLGQEARRGIALAVAEQSVDSLADSSNIEVHYLDSKGTNAGAVLGVKRAVELGALFVLGPVGVEESRQVAHQANQFGVPLLTLASHSELAAIHGFQMVPTPEWEARQAAMLSIAMGLDQLAVLYPRDELGELQANAFVDYVNTNGAEITRVSSYDPSGTTIEEDVRSFLRLSTKNNSRLHRHLRRYGKKGWKTFSPDVSFDGVYLPDRYDRTAHIVSYFPYYNVELRTQEYMSMEWLKRKHQGRLPRLVQLIGGSGWHHPGWLVRGGETVEGSVLVDVFAGGELEEYGTEAAAAFADKYRSRYGILPSKIAALAYDAVQLAVQAMDRLDTHRVSRTRRNFSLAMRDSFLDNGVCGKVGFSLRGFSVREALPLKVSGGQFLHETNEF